MSVSRGTNLSRIAGYNEAVLIDAIRRARGGLSRVELTALSGLSAQTVSNICRRMLESGLVLEGERVAVGLGKPRTMLTLNPVGQYAIGVHLDPLVMTFVLLDFTGAKVARAAVPTPMAASPDAVLRQVSRTLDDLVTGAAIDRSRIAGIGFASPGPIDARAGIILDPPHLPGWRNVRLCDHLRDTTNLPVVLDKDVVAAAVGEKWAGATLDFANSIFVYLGTGVGVGVTIDNSVIRGYSGNAGDVGHLIVDPDGPQCSCGLRGCLGVTASPVALVRQAVAEGVLPPTRLKGMSKPEPDPERVHRVFSELCDLADGGNPHALSLIHTTGDRLAKGVSTVTNLVDTEAAVFGGPTWSRLAHHLLDVIPVRVRSQLVRRDLGPLRVLGTALGEDVVAIGAACLVLDRVFSPNPSSFALDASAYAPAE